MSRHLLSPAPRAPSAHAAHVATCAARRWVRGIPGGVRRRVDRARRRPPRARFTHTAHRCNARGTSLGCATLCATKWAERAANSSRCDRSGCGGSLEEPPRTEPVWSWHTSRSTPQHVVDRAPGERHDRQHRVHTRAGRHAAGVGNPDTGRVVQLSLRVCDGRLRVGAELGAAHLVCAEYRGASRPDRKLAHLLDERLEDPRPAATARRVVRRGRSPAPRRPRASGSRRLPPRGNASGRARR